MTRDEFLYSPKTLPITSLFDEITHLHQYGVSEHQILKRLDIERGHIRRAALYHNRPDIMEIISASQ